MASTRVAQLLIGDTDRLLEVIDSDPSARPTMVDSVMKADGYRVVDPDVMAPWPGLRWVGAAICCSPNWPPD